MADGKSPSTTTGRLLNAWQVPLFQIRPPRDYGVLTTTGRTSGKRRRRCVRAVRRGDRVFLVAIKGAGITGWAKNALANPQVGLRLPGGRFTGRAREIRPAEMEEGREAYSADVGWFERGEWRIWREGKFTPEKSRELHREWFDTGTPLVIELQDS